MPGTSAYQDLVIIGAPRSGTNMLRDALVQLPGLATWPCDEINYIWRHGNLRHPSDAFTPSMATPSIRQYIRGQFDSLANLTGASTVVEKTCANSLRVGFVDQVLPEAKYIFIIRNGVDAVASAMDRWTAGLDLSYVMKKARYVPPTDLPYYASKYLRNHLRRWFSSDRRLAFWGPALDDMQQILQQHSLAGVCALQWQACVEKAEADFARLPAERVLRIRYEDVVSAPQQAFLSLAEFCDTQATEQTMTYLKNTIRAGGVGKGSQRLGETVTNEVQTLIGQTLENYGYR